MTLDEADVTLAMPDTQSDLDATRSIAPRRINTDEKCSDRFWRMESDSDIAMKALLASRSPKYAPRTDHQQQLSLRLDVLVRDWEVTTANHAADLETQRLLNVTTSQQVAEQLALC